MSTFTIDQLRAVPDVAKVTKWDLSFITLPAVGALGFPLSSDLNIRCESVELPKATNEKFEVMIRGHKTIHNGRLDYGNTLSLVFTETVDNKMLLFVQAWKELLWASRTGKAFAKKDLEATMLLTLHDNTDKPRAMIKVYGCIFESEDFGSLEASGENIKCNLTIHFDFFTVLPLTVK